MEEVELYSNKDDYEVVPLTPIRRLENKIKQIEHSSTIPQLQTLITEIVQLIRTNQKIVDDVLRSDMEMKREMTKLIMKMDDTINEMKSFVNLVKASAEEEISFPPEVMKPLAEQIQKLVEQNQKTAEINQHIMETLNEMSKKLKTGTPVSRILSNYPNLKIKNFEK